MSGRLLFTIEEMCSRLPKDAVKPSVFKKLVVQHGTYRDLDGAMLMTERDFQDFLDAVCARRTKPTPPPPHEAGLMVFIGHPLDKHALVLVAWAPYGQELSLLDMVKVGAQERVQVLGTVDATPIEVEAFRKKHTKSWRCGYWFARSDALVNDLNRMTGEIAEEGEDEFEPEKEVAGAESGSA